MTSHDNTLPTPLIVMCIAATLTGLINLIGLSLALLLAKQDAFGPTGSSADKLAFLLVILVLLGAPIFCWVALFRHQRVITVALALIPISIFLAAAISSAF